MYEHQYRQYNRNIKSKLYNKLYKRLDVEHVSNFQTIIPKVMSNILWGPNTLFYVGGEMNPSFYQIHQHAKDKEKYAVAQIYPNKHSVPESLYTYGYAMIDNNLNNGNWTITSPTIMEAKTREIKHFEDLANKEKYVIKRSPTVRYSLHDWNTVGYSDPTGNCQIGVIGYYESLSRDNEERKTQLRLLFAHVSKAMVLIDIKQSIAARVTDIFKPEDIVINQPYTSTNGSHMVLFLVKTKNL